MYKSCEKKGSVEDSANRDISAQKTYTSSNIDRKLRDDSMTPHKSQKGTETEKAG
jgi:hypothetical protein